MLHQTLSSIMHCIWLVCDSGSSVCYRVLNTLVFTAVMIYTTVRHWSGMLHQFQSSIMHGVQWRPCIQYTQPAIEYISIHWLWKYTASRKHALEYYIRRYPRSCDDGSSVRSHVLNTLVFTAVTVYTTVRHWSGMLHQIQSSTMHCTVACHSVCIREA